MDVYSLLNLAANIESCQIRIYDLVSEEVAWSSKDYDGYDVALEVDYIGFGSYEVMSYDIYSGNNGVPCLEINIEIFDDEEDE